MGGEVEGGLFGFEDLDFGYAWMDGWKYGM